MGILKDVSDAIKDMKNIVSDVDVAGITSGRAASIARMSSQATLQFPIITSRSIDIDTAQAVSKALERQYASFVQIVISLNPYIDLSKDKNMSGYLKKIHQNNPKMSDILNESCTNVYSDEAYCMSVLFSLNEGSNGFITSSNKKQMFSIEESLNRTAINDLHKPQKISLALAETKMQHYCRGNKILTEAPTNAEIDAAGDQTELGKLKLQYDIEKDAERTLFDRRKYNAQTNRDIRRDMEDKRRYDAKTKLDADRYAEQRRLDAEKRADDLSYRDSKDKIDDNRYTERLKREDERNSNADKQFQMKYNADKQKHDEKMELDKARFQNDIKQMELDYRSKAQVRLADNDVKKSNELVPTTLSVTMNIKDGQSFGGVNNFIIGVKGLLHPVQSNEMVSNLLNGYRSNSKFFNFIRWTTGEITFVKDLLLNVDGIKEDVVKKHTGGSHWWSTLKRRKSAAKVNNTFSRNKILPNASIVCSMEEIIEMKESYGIDLMEPKNIIKMMDNFFLLGFVVVDNSQEICYFIFDGEKNYQAISFKGLDKENNSKNDFKEIYKMINSGRL